MNSSFRFDMVTLIDKMKSIIFILLIAITFICNAQGEESQNNEKPQIADEVEQTDGNGKNGVENGQWRILAPVILSPIVIALIGFIFSGIGISGKLKRIEYYGKRYELIDKILSNTNINIRKESLKDEIRDIVTYLEATSLSIEEKAQLDFNKKKSFNRHVTLPKPTSVGGWIATILYYMYGFTFVVYLLAIIGTTFLFEANNTPEENQLFYYGLFGSAAIAFGARLWAINIAKSRK